MNKIGKKIEDARQSVGLNQSQLARALNVTPQAVQKWESGEMSPRNSRLQQIANILGVSIAHLVSETDVGFKPIELTKNDCVIIPLIANEASMGSGELPLEDDIFVNNVMLSTSFVKKLGPVKPKSLRFIHSYGDSMSPTLNSGDILLVDTETKIIKIDGIYVLRAHDRLFVKRVRQRIDGNFEISSDNPTHKTVDILNGESEVSVIGRVVFYWNGRRVS